ncbi:CPBP family intramembrane glutamic endopeptidase [Ruegeria arenilitoris]|uniref:CPBP family intramembrane glutamic endopeptidase n=1 Tax=Ruegeria arenilitoris TaxID=1173585 RepID=UPI00147BBA72|nr:CPBP family intramembrane glutamic endopeptidase [Ruegeria arenilitoris]
MNVKPNWQVAILVFVAYNLIVFATWYATGADYTTLSAANNIASHIVLPLLLGAIFLFVVLSFLGWWRPVMREETHGAPKWMMWVLLVIAAGFIGLNLASTNWSAITATHLLFLVAAGVLVGFNEEALTRGILIVGCRGSTNSEVFVWLFSSVLFGLMHLPNTLFGMPFAGGVAQVFFAATAGTGFYILRRASGTLLVPMAVHGLWDFATFSHGASGAPLNFSTTPFQFAMYVVSIVLVVIVFRKREPARS